MKWVGLRPTCACIGSSEDAAWDAWRLLVGRAAVQDTTHLAPRAPRRGPRAWPCGAWRLAEANHRTTLGARSGCGTCGGLPRIRELRGGTVDGRHVVPGATTVSCGRPVYPLDPKALFWVFSTINRPFKLLFWVFSKSSWSPLWQR